MAVSTRGGTVFVPDMLKLYMYEMISDPGMRHYPSLVALALRTPGWGFHTVRTGNDQGDHRFRPRVVGSCKCTGGFLIRERGHTLPEWRWFCGRQPICNRPVGEAFNTVPSGVDPGNHRLGPRFVEVVDVWNDS